MDEVWLNVQVSPEAKKILVEASEQRGMAERAVPGHVVKSFARQDP